ncbi:hypothetical protein [Streptomyces sp. NPDC048295]|uniref:hypothetical protein n=1 Tax=Streptomyces sp. NPDC048295 TaxID=3154617 RepID=UPI00342E86E7
MVAPTSARPFFTLYVEGPLEAVLPKGLLLDLVDRRDLLVEVRQLAGGADHLVQGRRTGAGDVGVTVRAVEVAQVAGAERVHGAVPGQEEVRICAR